MPESCEASPISMPKARRKLPREIRHPAQMFFKIMDGERSVLIPTHMGQISLCHRVFPRPRTPPSSGTNGTLPRRLCLSMRILYNRPMAFDPDHPPIWLRKLHVSAAQINPTDYPVSAVEGILAVGRLSSAQHRWISALRSTRDKSDLADPTLPPP